MTIRRFTLAVLALLMPLSAAACSDDSTGDLDRGELSSKLQDEMGIEAELADCIADALVEADFTEEELESFDADADTDKARAYAQAVSDCMGIELPDDTGVDAEAEAEGDTAE